MKLGDLEKEAARLLYSQGEAMACLIEGANEHVTPQQRAQLRQEIWTLLPFIKALRDVVRAHPEECLAAWKRRLEEPMPFGLPPVGLPKEEE